MTAAASPAKLGEIIQVTFCSPPFLSRQQTLVETHSPNAEPLFPPENDTPTMTDDAEQNDPNKAHSGKVIRVRRAKRLLQTQASLLV